MKIFITGGTTGIGLSLAEAYLREGHRVGVCGRDLSKLPPNFLENYPKAKAYTVDVTNKDQLFNAVENFAPDSLDIMIANAGRSEGSKPTWPDFDVYHNIIDVNVNGVLYAFEAALKVMKKQGRGHLVGIASVASFVGLPGAGAYCASKAAVLRLCESLAIDFGPQGFNVTAICPGFIDTPLTRRNKHPMPFLMSSDEGAGRIKRAIARKKVIYVFPFRMKIIITILDKMPRWLYQLIWKIPGIRP
jgi:NAD(P)-dependent dehydrogenase (short-subunit alcohol dehydrogenase family)